MYMGTKIREAEEFGIDLSLLLENLKLTPTERLQKLQNQVRFHAMLRKAKRLPAEHGGPGKNRKSSDRT
jgi:hypothetical protein